MSTNFTSGSAGHAHGLVDIQGVEGQVVTTTDTQTLTNKTLTSPTLSSPTLTTPVFSGSASGDGTLRYQVTDLTNAQIKALRATPVTVVSAPGTGKVNIPVSGVLILNYGTNALTTSSDPLNLNYAGDTQDLFEPMSDSGFIDATADTIQIAYPAYSGAGTGTLPATCVNKAITLRNSGSGEYAGNAANDTTMRVVIAYYTFTTGL